MEAALKRFQEKCGAVFRPEPRPGKVCPPEWLERLVLLVTPPACREAVVGDLCETYVSPPHYAREALTSVPLVIASQMRRNANLPALGLQAFLVFICVGGFSVSRAGSLPLILPMLAVLGLLLRGAYQATGRPSTRRAIIEAIVVAYGALIYSQGAMLGMSTVQGLPHHALLGMQFVFLVPYMPLVPPLLCLFRAGLIITGDGNRPFPAYTIRQEDVISDYALFARRIRRRNRHEAGALFLAAVFGLVFLHDLPVSYALVGLTLIILYVLAAFYMVSEGAARIVPADADFLSLRVLYAGELVRQQQLRRFLLWLWLAPALVALRAALAITGQPATVMFGSAAAILSCFVISALNREHGGWVQEKIGMLDRVPEKKASLGS